MRSWRLLLLSLPVLLLSCATARADTTWFPRSGGWTWTDGNTVWVVESTADGGAYMETDYGAYMAVRDDGSSVTPSEFNSMRFPMLQTTTGYPQQWIRFPVSTSTTWTSDAQWAAGTFSCAWTETGKTVTVAAGTFTGCAVLRWTHSESGRITEFVLAPGVGIVQWTEDAGASPVTKELANRHATTPQDKMYVQPEGTFSVSGGITGSVLASGGYAYLGACNDGVGLYVLDVSDPANPVQRGTLSGCHNPRVLEGQYLYTGASIINVANPASPSLAFYNANAGGWGMVKDGAYGYVVSYTNTLIVLYFSSPTSFSIVTTLPIPVGSGNGARDIAKKGDYLFIATANGSGPGVTVVSVSNPASPSIAGTIAVGDFDHGGLSLALDGDTLYYGQTWSSGVDVSNPASPTVLHTQGTASSDAKGMDARYDTLYIAAGSELSVYDVASPTSWTRLFMRYRLLSPAGLTDYTDVDVEGEYAYVSTLRGLAVFSLTDLGGRTSPAASGASLIPLHLLLLLDPAPPAPMQ